MPALHHFVAITTFALLSLTAMAGEIDHFKGQPANTVEQAVANISKYNHQLEQLLAEDLSPAVMGQVHMLTYTLENALQQLDDSIDQLEDTLEEIHQASEYGNKEVVQSAGKQYLSNSRKIIQ